MKEQMEKENYKCKYINRKRSSEQEEGRNRPTEPETRASLKNRQKWIMCTELVALLLYEKVANCFLIEFADVLIFVRNRV